MQAADAIQVYSPHFQHHRGDEHQKVDDEQIFGDGRYLAKHLDDLQFDN